MGGKESVMEEERIIMSFGKTGKVGVDFILKTLSYFSEALNVSLSTFQNQSIVGETTWHKLIRSNNKIAIQEMANTEVNLDKLKSELKNYGIGFAFYQKPNSNTVYMAYAVKHENVVAQAVSDVLKEIADNPKSFMNNIKKEPYEQTLNEKLKYYKKQEQAEIKRTSVKQQATIHKQDSKSAFEEFFNHKSPGGKSL